MPTSVKLQFLIMISVNAFLAFTGGQPEYGIEAGSGWVGLVLIWTGYQIVSAVYDAKKPS